MERIIKLLIFIIIQLLQEASTESTENNSVTCNYAPKIYISPENITTCIVETSPKIHEENVTLEIFQDAGSLSDALEITNQEYFYIPNGIEQSFSNLTYLTIRHSKLKKVQSEHLKPFTNLEYLDLSFNEITVLEPNLFQYNENLIKIWLSNNTIYFIDPTAVVALKKIQFFNMYDNACYSFLSKSHKELMIDYKVSLCSIRLPNIFAEIAGFKEMSMKLSSQNKEFLKNLTSVQAEYSKMKCKKEDDLPHDDDDNDDDEDSEVSQNHPIDNNNEAILSSLDDLKSNIIANLSEKVSKAHENQLQDIKVIVEEIMDIRGSIVVDKHLIYIAGACILIIFIINTIFFYCIISYIKSLNATPQNIPHFDNNYEKNSQIPIQMQSVEARPDKMPDEHEEILHLNAELDVQPDEGLYSEDAVPLENLLQKTEENDENSQLYAVVLKN